VLVCIGVVDLDTLETGVVEQAAPRAVQEDAEEAKLACSSGREKTATLAAPPRRTP
jgi:hypothetical protein